MEQMIHEFVTSTRTDSVLFEPYAQEVEEPPEPMLNIDPSDYFVGAHQAELLAEADRDRLAAQVPRRGSGVRHDLALAMYRLAAWLDDPTRYLQRAESGPEDWATPLARV
jgi:hypothetical protein